MTRLIFAAAFLIIWLILFFGLLSYSYGRPGKQWAQLAPGETQLERAQRSAWFERQKMPDNPRISCCGEADAYYADSVEVDAEGRVFAIITDTREDAPLQRRHVEVGTRIEIPLWKNKDTRADPNLTGHTIVFLGSNNSVYCYLPDGGV